MKIYFSILVLLCLLTLNSTAQTTSIDKAEMGAVFKQTNTWFRTTASYSLAVTHASYENYTTTVPVEKSSGYFKKQGDNYHSFLLGIHTLQNKNYKIVIDTAEKIIVVSDPDQLTWLAYTQEDYDAILKNSKALRKNKTGRYTFYRVELPEENPVGAYEFLIDEKGLAREISWYYNKLVRKDENNAASGVKPRMRISFSAYKEGEEFNYTNTFSETPYFGKQGGKLVLTQAYSTFKLLDQRIKR